MIYLEFFTLLTLWCGLGASAFAVKAFDFTVYNPTDISGRMFPLYISLWFGAAYYVFELGKSPILALLGTDILMLLPMAFLSYWPVKEAIRLVPIIMRLRKEIKERREAIS